MLQTQHPLLTDPTANSVLRPCRAGAQVSWHAQTSESEQTHMAIKHVQQSCCHKALMAAAENRELQLGKSDNNSIVSCYSSHRCSCLHYETVDGIIQWLRLFWCMHISCQDVLSSSSRSIQLPVQIFINCHTSTCTQAGTPLRGSARCRTTVTSRSKL